MHDSSWIETLSRLLLVAMFPFSAFDKLLDWGAAMKQAGSSFLPGAPVLVVTATALELAAPVCIVVDWNARVAALLLALFCIFTALLYHPFWRQGDFWTRGNSVARAQFWDFTKNLGLAGGLFLVALGAGLAPLV